jgi:hypothetical protein
VDQAGHSIEEPTGYLTDPIPTQIQELKVLETLEMGAVKGLNEICREPEALECLEALQGCDRNLGQEVVGKVKIFHCCQTYKYKIHGLTLQFYL